jgi:hypothetical protein
MPTNDEAKELRSHPDRWPARPFLPLVRGDESDPLSQQLGVLIEGGKNVVYLCNLVDASVQWLESGSRVRKHSPAFKQWLSMQGRLAYSSFDSVLDDGWRID